jgi:tetratricopeptide (TPR) repeat protein
MNAAAPTASLQIALAHAARLLQADPALAGEQANEILRAVGEHPQALLLLGLSHGRRGEHDAAIAALRRALALQPDLPQAWRALGDALGAAGDFDGADDAYAQHVRRSVRDPRLLAAAAALGENRIPEAEKLLREHLKRAPTDVAAIRMFAELAARIGRLDDAENLLARCLELAPGFDAARRNYALVLHRNNKPQAALAEIEKLLAAEPGNPGYRNLKAVVLCRVGDYDQAIGIYRDLAEPGSRNSRLWMSYGHALKTAGLRERAVAAYRRSLELEPSFGEVWWSLANLKTVRFGDEDVATMRKQLGRGDISAEDRYHLEFALGKALEDAGDYAGSFAHYERGNAQRRAELPYDADETTARVRRIKRGYTKEFFAERAGSGCDAPDPIFIVGLPRAGSTLLEQILSSHSQVEGTMELPEIISITRELRKRSDAPESTPYHDLLETLDAAELRELGERYLANTRIQRKTGAPFFIDKMPNNFLHVGLIRLILPNAKIVDARRHPLGCCFSGFKQHFARGQGFTYSLADVGRYYRDYVELMAHFDAVLPGRVHRVFHERIVEDLEGEVRRLLDYCGLPFEDACLRFHENGRAVRTASSEQVRRPINRDGVDQWRRYEPWLQPLKDALGPVLDAYPEVPEFPRH